MRLARIYWLANTSSTPYQRITVKGITSTASTVYIQAVEQIERAEGVLYGEGIDLTASTIYI